MKTTAPFRGINRRAMLSAAMALLPALSALFFPMPASAQSATREVLCRRGTTAPRNRQSSISSARPPTGRLRGVSPEERIAAFDQDGTLWVEQPMYTQVVYCLDRVPDVVAKKPELKNKEPFKTVLRATARRSRSSPCRISRRFSPPPSAA